MPNSSATPGSGEPSALYDPAELGKGRWEQAGHRLLAKMIGEFSYGPIVQPEPEPEPEPETERGPEPELRPDSRPESRPVLVLIATVVPALIARLSVPTLRVAEL
ncbi:hypothetical protein ACFWFF_28770 [Streptomyces sp. NPDC060223]|uniref:hypothetical protein n=1 Tax=unclassified Streptomyces TaxID=2593676 RepID=UPI0036400CD9